MPNKTIDELQLRDNVTDDVNLPVSDGLQTYRTTALQWIAYIATKLVGATGDLIYGASATTLGKLAIGTTGQILSVVGGIPAWVNLPGKYHLYCYYVSSQTNYWSRSGTSYGDFSVTGTIPSPTTVKNSNFGTINKATSNLPGINLTAPRTGTMKITVTSLTLPGQVSGNISSSLKLLESVTGTDIAFASHTMTNNSATNGTFLQTFVGYFDATISTTYNFKLQGSIGTGATLYIGATPAEIALGFAIEYIT